LAKGRTEEKCTNSALLEPSEKLVLISLV